MQVRHNLGHYEILNRPFFSISHSLWYHIKFMVKCVVSVQIVTILQNLRVSKQIFHAFQPSLPL